MRPLQIGSVALALALVGTAAWSTVPVSARARHRTAPSGVLKVGLDVANVTFDPALSHAVEDGQVEDQIFNSLLSLSPKEQVGPELATHWTESPNGRVYTLFLRRGVTFTDGTPFNAAAVVFNLDRVLNPATASPRASLLGPVQSVTAVNAYEVRIVLKTPYGPFLEGLAQAPGDMSSPKAVQTWGKAYGQHPVGTGPYMLKKWVPGGDVTLAANPHYWQPGLPKMAEIVFIPIPNSQSMATALNTGEIDIADTVDPTVIGDVNRSVAKVATLPSLGFFMLNINQTRAPLNNIWARRAIAYAINRSVINKVVFNNTATPGYSEFSSSSWAYDKSLSMPFSDSLARQALAKAGMPHGFSLTLQVQNQPTFITFGQVLQSELGAVGIHVTIQTLDQATYLNNLNSGNYQLDYVDDSGPIDPDGDYIFNVGSADILKNGFNDPAVTKLMNLGRTVSNRLRRRDIYEQVAKDMLEQLPYVFLEYPAITTGLSNRVHGFVFYPNAGQFYLAGVSLGS